MNTNLRAMIDDALDGAYADEQAYGYADYSDVPVMVSGSDDAVKIASALNHVASNLNDLGTTEEKLAELELFSEMLKEANEAAATETAAKAGGEAAEKAGAGLADSWEALKTKSVPDVWKNMSTSSKVITGGAAGIAGLGALYGGYKMLSGGGGQKKESALDEARSRALVKMAQRYDVPVYELEEMMTKEAFSLRQARALKRAAGKVRASSGKSREGFFSKLYGKVRSGLKKVDNGSMAHLDKSTNATEVAAEAAEKATNTRRLLLAGGGVAGVGLGAYGLTRGSASGSPQQGQTKAASYMNKVAEDRINPARIRGGSADPFSGFDIRAQGGGGSRFDPVSLRAEAVRNKVNSDMSRYVDHVGGGYHLRDYLKR
jgi:hypothetical protein